MLRMAGCFYIEDAQRNELDRFTFMANGNHGQINNNSHCLFDGYYPEACGAWERIKNDMKIYEMIGHKIVVVK